MGLFTDDDIWNGGFYELALEYERGAVPGLVEGLGAVWHAEGVSGCYLECGLDPQAQPRAEFQPLLPWNRHLYGLATLSSGSRVACGTCCVREEDGADWLVFYLPMGALGYVYPVCAFPFDEENHEAWRRELDAWLVHLGRQVFNTAPFRLGLVGFETSGELRADDILRAGVPAKRPYAFLVPTPDGLVLHDRTSDA